jgi:hypothetical protein
METETPSETTPIDAPVESDYSGTDGSDTDDDTNYKRSLVDTNVQATEKARNVRVANILVANGFMNKLKAIKANNGTPGGFKVMFDKGNRPVTKNGELKPLFRKEAKFLSPSEKLKERTQLGKPMKQELDDLTACPPLTSRTASILNSSVYFARFIVSLIAFSLN